jgi:hypothetical protein
VGHNLPVTHDPSRKNSALNLKRTVIFGACAALGTFAVSIPIPVLATVADRIRRRFRPRAA